MLGRRHRPLPAAAPRWRLGLPAVLLAALTVPVSAQSLTPDAEPVRILDFRLVLPSNSEILFLALALIAVPLLAYGLYRVLLKGMVQKGTHPTHLRAALWAWVVFGIGLFALVLLPGLGQGWFLVLGVLLTVACLFLIISRSAVVSAVVALLVCMLIVVGLRAGQLI